jgi:hypothetical protein
LSQGVTANGVTLFVPMSVVTGSSNNVYALDNDTGYVVWKRTFDGTLPAASPACPGGLTAAATRIVPMAPPPLGAARPRRRPRRWLPQPVGQPGEGVPVEARGGGGRGGAAAPPAAPPPVATSPAATPAAAPAAVAVAAPPPPAAPPAAAGQGGRGAGGAAPAGRGRGGAPLSAGIPGARRGERAGNACVRSSTPCRATGCCT